jgi:hypothetical protein
MINLPGLLMKVGIGRHAFPAVFINSDELIFNYIFGPARKAVTISSLANDNYLIFLSKKFFRPGTNRSGHHAGILACFRFAKEVLTMKKYLLKQHFSTKSSLTATHAAGIFHSQRV